MKQNKIPPGWLNVKLGEVIELKYGKALPAQKRDGEKFPVYGSNGIVGYHSEPQIKGPALIVGRKGSIGEVHLSEEDCSCIDTTYFVDDFYGQPPVFWLNRLSCLNLAELNRATALPGLNRNDAYQLNLLFPPLKEQHRIVKKIEALQTRSSKARKALEAIPPLLEKFRQSVLSSAFRGDLTADWRAQNPDVEPAEKLLERIRQERRKRWEEAELAKMKAKGQTPKDDNWKKKYKEPEPVDTTDLPELPDGWCWASLEELSWNSSYGTSTKCDYDATGVPVLRIPNIEAGLVNQNDLKYSLADLSLQDEDYLAPCDFLIIRTNGSRNLIGRGALITDSFSEYTFFASYLIRFRFVNDINLCQWLSFVWHSPVVRNRIENLASTSAGQYNINMTKLNSIVFPIPPKAEIRKINFLLENALEKEVSLSTLSKSLSEGINKLNQSILAKAFCGELIPQDPNDEPAYQLLERIKQEKASFEAGKKQKGKVGRKKGIRKKEATAMAKKKEGRPLVEVLQPHTSGLSPEEPFQENGIHYGVAGK